MYVCKILGCISGTSCSPLSWPDRTPESRFRSCPNRDQPSIADPRREQNSEGRDRSYFGLRSALSEPLDSRSLSQTLLLTFHVVQLAACLSHPPYSTRRQTVGRDIPPTLQGPRNADENRLCGRASPLNIQTTAGLHSALSVTLPNPTISSRNAHTLTYAAKKLS